MTETELAELDRLEKAATPGPWYYDDGVTDGDRATGERGKIPWITTGAPMILICYPNEGNESYLPTIAQIDANSDLITAARNALPKLIKEIRMLRGTISAGLCRPGLGD